MLAPTTVAFTGNGQMLDVGNIVDQNAPLNQGLLGWWPYVLQLSGGGTRWYNLVAPQHGVLTNMALPPTSTSGWGRRTLRPGGFGDVGFDGTNDEVDITGILGTRLTGLRLTVALWFNPTSLSSAVVFDATTAGNKHLLLFLEIASTTTGSVAIGDTVDINLTFSPAWTTGQWQHLVMTSDGTTVRVYRNGAQNASATGAFGTGITTATWVVGSDSPSGLGVPFTGRMDDVRLYNRPLSAKEVLALYQASRTGYHRELRWLVPRLWSVVVAAGGGGGRTTKNIRSFGLGMQHGMGFGVPAGGRYLP